MTLTVYVYMNYKVVEIADTKIGNKVDIWDIGLTQSSPSGSRAHGPTIDPTSFPVTVKMKEKQIQLLQIKLIISL